MLQMLQMHVRSLLLTVPGLCNPTYQEEPAEELREDAFLQFLELSRICTIEIQYSEISRVPNSS